MSSNPRTVQLLNEAEVDIEDEWTPDSRRSAGILWDTRDALSVNMLELGIFLTPRRNLYDKTYDFGTYKITGEEKVIADKYLSNPKVGTQHIIPSYLLPETAAISVTALVSVVGLVATALLGTVSTIFVAPLIVSAAGGLFLIRMLRRHA